MVRYAKLLLPFDVVAVQRELISHRDEWQAHFNTAHYEGGWSVLALRAPAGDPKNVVADLIGNSEYQNTTYMAQFPAVKKLLSTINCPIMAVRFLNLQAGAIIKQHTDKELAFEKGEARFHFPVFTNPSVEFYIDDERIPLHEGECWYINANLPHRVSNKGAADRIHLVVDCKVNEWLSDMINSATELSHKEEHADTELLKKMIIQFRLQNTEVANQIADNLEQQLKAIHE